MARALVSQGAQRFVVIEKADSAGGTWRDNRYPGAACDVPSHLYSLSDAANPHWTRLFPSQPEILAYLNQLAAPFERAGQLRYGQRLIAAHWDEERQLWEACTEAGQRFLARDLIMAPGGLHHPAWPDLPGLQDFSGSLLHTARWPRPLDLRGKRVGVIGTGASAVQLIPELAGKAAELHVAMRTPPWVLPRPDLGLPTWLQARFGAWPWLRKALRGSVFILLEWLAKGLTRPRWAFWASWLGNRLRRRQVRDPILRQALQPDYPIGCKRVLFSNDFYPSLIRHQTTLHSTPIASVEADGWRLADGALVRLDAIVCATGFQPLRLRDDVDLRGRGGLRLAEAWADRPVAHLGIGVAGFPNLFFLLGPNTALGHNSVIYMIESQVRHIQALRRTRVARRATAVEPRSGTQSAFIADLDQRFAGTAWDGGCTSWYLDARGRNIALWIGPARSYRRRTRRVDPQEYLFDGDLDRAPA